MWYAEGVRAMTQRRIVLYATWGLCFGLMAVPELFSLSRAATIPITAAWLLLLIFGIVQIIRNELAKGERLKAMARGECSSCGYNMTGLESGVCPECGKSTGRPGTRRARHAGPSSSPCLDVRWRAGQPANKMGRHVRRKQKLPVLRP